MFLYILVVAVLVESYPQPHPQFFQNEYAYAVAPGGVSPWENRLRTLENRFYTLSKQVDTLEATLRDMQTALHHDWVRTDSGSKYKLFDVRRTWDDAMNTCKTYNARLAVVDNEDKNTFVKELVNNATDNVDYAWIGMRTRAEMASKPASYSNFDSDVQVSGCAVVDRSGIWAIRSCTQLRPFVCQQVAVV